MKYKHLVPSLLLTGAILALLTTPALSEEKSTIAVDKSRASTQTAGNSTQQSPLATNSGFVKPITDIPRVNEIERPARSARMLVQSPTPQATPASRIVQVSFVKANPTNKGLELVLQTSKAATLQLENRTQVNSNTFIVDIPNAQLRLPGNRVFSFRSQKPIAGITEITVTNFDANTIRVTVTGEASAPIVELYDSPKEGMCMLSITGLILWPGWRKLIAGFKIKLDAHPQRANFDIHKVAGMITVVFIFFTGFTGFCWNFSFTSPIIYAVTFTPQPSEPVSKPIPGKSTLKLVSILGQTKKRR